MPSKVSSANSANVILVERTNAQICGAFALVCHEFRRYCAAAYVHPSAGTREACDCRRQERVAMRLNGTLKPICLVALCTILVQLSFVRNSYGDGGSKEHGRTVYVWSTSGSGSPGSTQPGTGRYAGTGRESGWTSEPVVWCSYVAAASSSVAGLFTPTGTGVWYRVTCHGDGLTLSDDSALVWLAGSAEHQTFGSRTVSLPTALAERAESSMTLPSPEIRTNPDSQTFVNLETWFWIDPSQWHPYTATAVSGGVRVTAVARPVQVVFATGDGATITCSGGGTPYGARAAGASSVCIHTYSSSSAGQPSPNGSPNDSAFVVKATVTWSVSWTLAGSNRTGTLPGIVTSSVTGLRVAQIESVQDT